MTERLAPFKPPCINADIEGLPTCSQSCLQRDRSTAASNTVAANLPTDVTGSSIREAVIQTAVTQNPGADLSVGCRPNETVR